MLSGAARYDCPHLYLRKDGRRFKDVASYVITICNDGNAALGPIFLLDLFPEGARFVNATLRPNQIENNSTKWTLLHMAIGDTIRIGINLDVAMSSTKLLSPAITVAGRWRPEMSPCSTRIS
jgi:uncharacterized repeat protein (TIGR01451 family)